jgi:spermidine synthase
MYHVISTATATILLYLTSYFFSRTGFYSVQDNRKFWNLLLAVVFLLTASAGIFLALQITYKWNIPFIKSVLKWHVEVGIGFAITGIFHFIWHLSYFNKIFRPAQYSKPLIEPVKPTSKQIRINLIIIGFVSTAVQVLLIREIMNIAGGYELITGTFLGSWLIGSAAGALMAGRSNAITIRRINLIFAIAPIISVLFLITFERLFLNSGETPSYFLSIIISLLALLPFCFVSGFTFIKLINYSVNSRENKAGISFSIETVGSIIAGVAVSVLTSGLVNTYQLLVLIIILNLIYVLLYYFDFGKKKIFIASAMGLLAICTFAFNPDIFFRQLLLPGIKVTESYDTPYGNITSADYKGEESIYYNQRLQSWSNDEIEREENIHYAMLQHEKPEKVLLISGDIRSNMKEVNKYNVRQVTCLERDPALLNTELKDKDTLLRSVTVISTDAFRFIKTTSESFDVILLLLPPPSTLLINRYYTTEFFAEVKKRIGNKGIFSCSPGSGENYYNRESAVLYSSIFNSLKSVFRNVVPIAGNKLYFVSSDAGISTSVLSLSAAKNLKNLYVNTDYLSDDQIGKRSAEVLSVIDPGVRKNSFKFPVACFHYQSYNLSKNLNEKIPALILLILIFVLPLFSVRRKNLVMFSAAAALSGFEIVVLLLLQTTAGNMYLLTGLIIASLMAGLAAGSGILLRWSPSRLITLISLAMIIFYICTGLILNSIIYSGNYIITVALLMFLIFIPASLTGQLFNVMTSGNEPVSNPASVYSADLAGSALGFITVSGLIIPAAGIRNSILLLSVIIFTALLFGTIRSK